MNLKDYLKDTDGRGVLATSDADGQVDVAVYSKPHCMEDKTIAFVMRERLTYKNLKDNSRAAYLFMAQNGYTGFRLFLTKIREDNDPELIKNLSRRNLSPEEDTAKGPKHVVYFTVDKALELIGAAEINLTDV